MHNTDSIPEITSFYSNKNFIPKFPYKNNTHVNIINKNVTNSHLLINCTSDKIICYRCGLTRR